MDTKGKNSILKKYTVAAEQEGLTLENYLKDVLKISARTRQKLFYTRTVYLNGKNSHSKHTLKLGDIVGVREFFDTNYGVTPEKGIVDVLYEDKDVIVLNKPSGLLVHPAGKTTKGTLANFLAYYFQQKQEMITIRPLHRLDRDTTGCVLFAKSAKAQTILETELANSIIHRRYEALVMGNGEKLLQLYPKCCIELPIGRDPLKANRRKVVESGQLAITCFRIIKALGAKLLLEIELKTGKTHQIRVHFSHIGFPLVGDKMYGTASNLIRRQALHAKYIEFKHPVTGKTIEVVAPEPDDFFKALKATTGAH